MRYLTFYFTMYQFVNYFLYTEINFFIRIRLTVTRIEHLLITVESRSKRLLANFGIYRGLSDINCKPRCRRSLCLIYRAPFTLFSRDRRSWSPVRTHARRVSKSCWCYPAPVVVRLWNATAWRIIRCRLRGDISIRLRVSSTNAFSFDI